MALGVCCGVYLKMENLGVKFDAFRLSHIRVLLSETCRGGSPPQPRAFR